MFFTQKITLPVSHRLGYVWVGVDYQVLFCGYLGGTDEASETYRLTSGNAVADDVCEGGQEDFCVLGVDVHLFRNPAG